LFLLFLTIHIPHPATSGQSTYGFAIIGDLLSISIKGIDIFIHKRYSSFHKRLLKNKKGKPKMQLSQTQTEPVTVNELITWAREIDTNDLRSFVDRRTNLLGEMDDDDFELASV
jgi:hypothetical protein